MQRIFNPGGNVPYSINAVVDGSPEDIVRARLGQFFQDCPKGVAWVFYRVGFNTIPVLDGVVMTNTEILSVDRHYAGLPFGKTLNVRLDKYLNGVSAAYVQLCGQETIPETFGTGRELERKSTVGHYLFRQRKDPNE